MASLFVSQRLTRYGSGGWSYAWRHEPCPPGGAGVASLGPPGTGATLTWVAGDEFCARGQTRSAGLRAASGIGFRQYWARGDGRWDAPSELEGTAFIPLGPRHDFRHVAEPTLPITKSMARSGLLT